VKAYSLEGAAWRLPAQSPTRYGSHRLAARGHGGDYRSGISRRPPSQSEPTQTFSTRGAAQTSGRALNHPVRIFDVRARRNGLERRSFNV